MRKIFLLLLMIPALTFAQKGIQFEHGLTWKEIQAKAKAENRYIFMDAFTTWCGPCRFMSANIFPQEEVGNFFNAHFINVAAQLDTTKNDNEEVKKWYADAHNIMVDNKVMAFPTYLFFDPNGKIVHRAVGSSTADVFVSKAKDAMNPDKQYYVLLDKYKHGEKDAAFLRKTANASLEAYDLANANIIANEYLAGQKDLFTKENFDFIEKFTRTTKDKGFALMLNNTAKFDAIKGEGTTNRKLIQIIEASEVYPTLFRKGADTPDWQSLLETLEKKYPQQAKEVVSSSKVMYYQNKKDWNNFEVAVQEYMKNFGTAATPAQLNSYAWTVFENCKDMTCVKDALEWSRRSFKENNEPMFMDTYANILYKLGKKEEAIVWEEKAANLIGNPANKEYLGTLEKMKKGEKTWKE